MLSVVILIPLSLYLLPIYYFAIGYRFGLAQSFIVFFSFGIACLHGFYRGLVQYVDDASADAVLKFLGAESLALFVEVRDVEVEHRAQGMPHHFLLVSVACHLASKQLADDGYLAF